jgi:hypothetical protein
MVTKAAENGSEWEGPPYTQEEKFYRRFGQGVVEVAHGSRTIVPQPPRSSKNDPPESQTSTPAK